MRSTRWWQRWQHWQRWRWIALPLLALAPLLAAPASGWAQGVPPAARTTVRVGQTFTITLPANHSTGYAWTLAQPPDARLATSLDSRYAGPAPGSPPGAGGQEEWTFRAVGVGETTLTLEYRRSFEPATVPAAQTYHATVVVTGATGLPRTGTPLKRDHGGSAAVALAFAVAGLIVVRQPWRSSPPA